MTDYTYTGTTFQRGVLHPNHVVALKVNVAGNPKVQVLAESIADAQGNFTLTWADWAGRTVIGAVDDDGVIQKLDCIFHDFQNGEEVVVQTGLTYEESVLLSGPIAYYKLDETSGTTAVDSSGNGNDGVYVSSPILGTGSLVSGEPSSVEFDGAATRVQINSVADNIIEGDDFSYECWFNGDDFSVERTLIGRNKSSQTNSLIFGVSATGFLKIFDVTTSSSYFSDVPINTNQTYYTVLKYVNSTGTFHLYINANEVGGDFPLSGLNTLSLSGVDLLNIGQEWDGASVSDVWDGRIDEVAIYKRALSCEEIKEHYRLGIYGTLNPTYEQTVLHNNPYIYLKFDDTAPTNPDGGTATDSSGNGRDAVYRAEAIEQPSIVSGEPFSVDLSETTTVRYVIIGHSLLLQSSVGCLEFWFKPNWNSDDGIAHQLFTIQETNNVFQVEKFSNNFWYIGWVINNTDYRVVISPDDLSVKANTDHFISVVWDEVNGTEVYVDGELVGHRAELTTIPNTLSTNNFLGARATAFPYSSPNVGSDMFADEFAVYHDRQTPEKIRERYLIGRYGTINPPYDQVVAKSEPLVYYKLDDTSGTVVTDSSGNGYNGTYSGSPSLTAGSITQGGTHSVDFDGVNDYVIGDTTIIPSLGATSFSMECWIRKDASGVTPATFAFNDTTKTPESEINVFVVLPSDTGMWLADMNSPSGALATIAEGAIPIDDKKDYHTCLVFDLQNDLIRCYVNGVEDTEGEFPLLNYSTVRSNGITEANAFHIGMELDGANPSNLFDGMISNAAIYTHAMSPQEIRDHYQAGRLVRQYNQYSDLVLADDPLVYYKLDETTGTTAIDSSGNGNDGTYTGGVTLNQDGLIEQGRAASFDGVDDHITRAALGSLIDYPITFDAWFKLDTLSTCALVATNAIVDGYAGLMMLIGSSGSLSIVSGDGGTNPGGGATSAARRSVIALNAVEAQKTTHAVIVARSQTDADIYVNSIKLPITTSGTGGAMNTSVGTFYIARDVSANGNQGNRYIDGFIDEVSITRKEITPQQVKDRYFAGLRKRIPQNGLVAHWRFDETLTNTTVVDSAGTFNGTLTSTAIRDADGKLGNGLVGDDTNYVDLGTASDLLNLGATSEFTVAFWYYNDSIIAPSTSLVALDLGVGYDSGNTSNNHGLIFGVRSDGLPQFRVEQNITTGFNGASRGRWIGDNTIVPDEWNLIVLDRTNAEANIYILSNKGELRDTLSFAGSNLTTWVSDGNFIFRDDNSQIAGSVNHTDAGNKLDELMVYNRVLSKQERDALWQLGGGGCI